VGIADANPRIAVYGAGALGAYFGGRLAHAGANVHLIARGRQLEALRKGPLRVESVNGDFETTIRATSEPAEVGPCDAVVICVKTYHMDEVAQALGPLIGKDTAVVPLQNGIAHIETLQDAVGHEHVLGGAAFIFASVPEPGLVVHSAGPGSIVFGELDGALSDRAHRLSAALAAADIGTELVENIVERMWAKFAYICAHAGTTSAARLPIGAIRDCEPTWRMFRRLIEEVIELARAEGVELDPATADGLVEFAAGLEPGSLSSMYMDLEAGRQTELEALHGVAVTRARRHGLELPMNEAVYALLAARAAAIA
jgi:2-dehydropantoate 2-reductase